MKTIEIKGIETEWSYIFLPPKDCEEASAVQKADSTEKWLGLISLPQKMTQISALKHYQQVFPQCCPKYSQLLFSQALFLCFKNQQRLLSRTELDCSVSSHPLRTFQTYNAHEAYVKDLVGVHSSGT